MRYLYKDPESGEVFEYESEEDRATWGAPQLVRMSKKEAEEHLLPANQTQDEINSEARAYLDSTDWYVIRQHETGKSIPSEIIDARADARSKVISQ